MIRYTFIVYLVLVLIIPSAHSTNTDKAKLKALETEIKTLEQERKDLNIRLDRFKKRNKETMEKLKELKKKKKKIIAYRRRYDERYGKSYVDKKLIEINNAIHFYGKRKKHDEEQIDKGTKMIEAKDKIISDKKIAYEKMKQTFFLGKYWVVDECQVYGKRQTCVIGYWVWNSETKKYDAWWDHPDAGLLTGELRIVGEYDKNKRYTGKVSIIRSGQGMTGQYYGQQINKKFVRGVDKSNYERKQADWYKPDWSWETLYIGNKPPPRRLLTNKDGKSPILDAISKTKK